MDEITPDELYDRMVQYGLFSEKLPPIFDASDFLSYCKKEGRPTFPQQWYPYASFDSMRNTNIPRTIGIPTPMAHERVCACMKEHWRNLQEHFKNTTSAQKHIVSRIHIRKMRDTDALFKMNYSNWIFDGTPEPDISLGKRYLVKADISKCFPSIYSHAIAWALATKPIAKQNAKDDSLWYNKIDLEVRNSTNGETHGLLIGPHTSNVFSEVILCMVDSELCKRWDYVRNIDDYSCYVNSKDDADKFLIDLNSCLRVYDLSLNHKKTEIIELPIGAVEQWIHQIQDKTVYLEKFHPYVDYREAQAFLDFCIELMAKNKENASILLYGIKVLQGHNLTANAKGYVAKTLTSLALNYPYIVPYLDEYVYTPYGISKNDLARYINLIFTKYIEKDYFEAVSYVLYLATKYDIVIDSFDVKKIILKNDCILSLCCLIYCRHFKLRKSLDSLKKYAKKLKSNNEFEEQWLFTYECLTVGLVSDSWKEMKKDNISFLKTEYR
jgi:hypothetical protein